MLTTCEGVAAGTNAALINTFVSITTRSGFTEQQVVQLLWA